MVMDENKLNSELVHQSIQLGLQDIEEGRIKKIPDITLWNDEPEQLELDLSVVSQWDDTKPYSAGQISFYFDRVLTVNQWNEFVTAVDEAVINKGWPEFTLTAIIKSGTDRELFPEAYEDESEESNRTGQEEV